MSYNFNSSATLANRMNVTQTTAPARAAFDEGFQSIPIWNILSAFDITSLERDSYIIQKREPEILTTMPEIMSCGQDIPVVNGNPEGRPVWYVPSRHRIAIQMCKDKCSPQTFQDQFLQAEREAGAGFGKLMEQLFWGGDGIQNGITRMPGLELFGAAGTPFANLHTKNAVEIANFFSAQIHGMDDPRMYMGPIMLELLGWREQDPQNCSEVWMCVLTTLSRRFNETVEQTNARFTTIPAFDFMTGIDPLNPNNPYSALMIVDRAFTRMGVSNEELGVAISNGHDFAETTRAMYLTTPQATREGAVRFSFGQIPQAEIAAQVGTRYGSSGAPAVTVQTPIV